MTAPKSIFPGQLVELERRTAHRQFLLRPGKDTRELAGYMYAKALLDFDQQACVACCMSNHYHAIQLDRSGLRSGFMQQFHSNTARKRNLQLNRRENLWATAEPGDMVLLDMDSVVRKVLYVCMQPVTAGCVARAADWTGFQILPRDWGKPMRFKRPALCGSDMPEFVEFIPMPPPGFAHQPLDEVIAFFEHLLQKEERRAAKKGRMVLGIAYCEALNPYYTPKTKSPMRKLNPRFSCQNLHQLVHALQISRKFRQQHRQALREFRRGRRDVVFPAGTLQMASLACVRCAGMRGEDPRMTNTTWSAALREQWDDWTHSMRRCA